MTKIKLLLGIVLLVSAFNFIKLFYYFYNLNALDELLNANTEGHTLLVIYLFTLLLFFVAHVTLIKGLWHIIVGSYFNSKSVKAFQLGGILLLSFGIITLLFRLYAVLYTSRMYGDLMPHDIVQAIENGYTIILGFTLITITSILKNGLHIKSENELTI